MVTLYHLYYNIIWRGIEAISRQFVVSAGNCVAPIPVFPSKSFEYSFPFISVK